MRSFKFNAVLWPDGRMGLSTVTAKDITPDTENKPCLSYTNQTIFKFGTISLKLKLLLSSNLVFFCNFENIEYSNFKAQIMKPGPKLFKPDKRY